MDSMTVVPLPHGLMVDGSWVRSANLRELNGHDEREFAEMDESLPSVVRATRLLERVATFGKTAGSKDSKRLVLQLTVGDRVALMLHLRRLTFGDRMECIVTCPDCLEDMSVGLSARRLLQPAAREPSSEGQVQAGGLLLRIRPLTGADVENLATHIGERNPAEVLVRSCVLSSDRPLPTEISQEMIAAISTKLEEMDPQADIVLNLTCPNCKHAFKTPFHIEDLMMREIRSRMPQLEREVHWLAFNYHWSEQDILSLPMRRRGSYVDLINRTLSGESM